MCVPFKGTLERGDELNTLRLKAAIAGSGKSYGELAKRLELSQTCFSYKVNGRNEFKVSEVEKLSKALGLKQSEMFGIFFTKNVN